MKRLMGFVFIFVLLSISTAVAFPINIEMDSYKKSFPGETVNFNIDITNFGNISDLVKLSFNGKYLWWLDAPVSVFIEPFSTKRVTVYTRPTDDYYGKIEYKLIAESIQSNKTIKTNFTLEVKNPVEVLNITPVVENGISYIVMKVNSHGPQKLPIAAVLRDIEGNTIESKTFLINVNGSGDVKKKAFGRLLAGNYTISFSYYDQKEQINFSIEPIHDIVKTKTINSSLLSEVVTIMVENKGNVKEDYYIEEVIKTDAVTGFMTNPDACSGNSCSFKIEGLEPGSTAMIIYRIEYWPYIIFYIFGALAIIFVASFSFFKVTNPRIRKTHIKKGSLNYIVIEVKNPFIRNIKNVVVRDWVTPLAKVHRHFETLKPVARVSEAGTELIWKIGELKAKEERIITYKIKPRIEGALKMPAAYLRFRDNKGNSIKIYSKQLIIK